MSEAHAPLPKLSSSEEVAFKNCRLAHLFRYGFRYGPKVTNRKLSVGIGFHNAMEVKYLGGDLAAQHQAIDDWAEKRIAELAASADYSAKDWAEWQGDVALLHEMVDGYTEWAEAAKLDDGYTVVDVEQKHLVNIPGAATVLPIKLDLVQRSERTGRLRIVDFKTAASFSTDTTGFQLSEQNGNYQIGITAVYGERPTELAYRQARKMAPKTNPRSKPPYFREIPVVLTRDEMVERMNEYVAISKLVTDPERTIYANPGSCCGSWKNDWQAPCLKVHGGMDPLEALETSNKYEPQDPNARYNEETT